jgi:hypothetical protein
MIEVVTSNLQQDRVGGASIGFLVEFENSDTPITACITTADYGQKRFDFYVMTATMPERKITESTTYIMTFYMTAISGR